MAQTCQQCQARQQEVEAAQRRHFRASELFRVGAPADLRDGHRMYFTTAGCQPLCQAQRQQPPSYYRKGSDRRA